MKSLILTTGARLLIALFLAFSLYVLLRGHNAPGGGFIGGLIAACGFAIHAFASGVTEARRALRVDPRAIGTLGLASALVAGLMVLPLGAEPFAGIWGEVAGYKVSSVLLRRFRCRNGGRLAAGRRRYLGRAPGLMPGRARPDPPPEGARCKRQGSAACIFPQAQVFLVRILAGFQFI